MATKLECIRHADSDTYCLQLALPSDKGVHVFLKAKGITNDPVAICAFVNEAMKQAQAFGRADLKSEFCQLMGVGRFM